MEIFANNPEPFKNYDLETNSSTLAFSNNHILIHDNKKLILFDLNKNKFGIRMEWQWLWLVQHFIMSLFLSEVEGRNFKSR